jgi:uncharacterized protein (DUF1810 family)
VSDKGSVFERLLDKYFRGARDEKTLRLISTDADRIDIKPPGRAW